MAAQRVLLRSPPVDSRRHPLLPKSKMGEMAGGTAAVCCCCPFTVMNLLTWIVYKVPVGVWRKQKRRRLAKKRRALLLLKEDGQTMRSRAVDEKGINGIEMELRCVGNCKDDEIEDADGVVRLEKEMWDTFYGTGFWRSPSQRDT